MITEIVANLKPLPYQGSALPLSYGSAGAPYAFKSLGNQWLFEFVRKHRETDISAVLSRTKQEDAPAFGTFQAQSCSSPVLPSPPVKGRHAGGVW